jgi:DNA-binding CsgD family transcriptional regulator
VARLHIYTDVVARLQPDLAMRLQQAAIQHDPDDSPETMKRRIFQLLFATLDCLPTPLLLVVEDIHWADDRSLEFLLRLARSVSSRQMVLLLTMRPDEPSPALRAFLAALERERLGDEIALAHFAPPETERMIGLMVQQVRVQAEFVAAIQELTDGNPFFIEETLRSLAANGDIYRAHGVWTRKPLKELRIPRTFDDAVERRLSRLSLPARELLATAAVLGRRFDLALLQQVTGVAERELLVLLKEAVGARLVAELPADRPGSEAPFAFAHALTRHVIAARLLARERVLIHQQALAAMEVLYADDLDRHAPDLARHAAAAGRWAQAHRYASCAATQALALSAPHAALEQLSRALDALARGESAAAGWNPGRTELLRQRADAYELLGDFDGARADHEALLQAARDAGDRRLEWQSLFDLGFLWTARDMAQAQRYQEQALAAARAMGDPALLGQTLNRIGNWRLNMGEPAAALAHHSEAREIFVAAHDPASLAATDDLLGISSLVGGDFLAGARHYAAAIAGFRAAGNRQGLISALATASMLGGAFQVNTVVVVRQPPAEALRLGEEALHLAQELRWRAGAANAQTYLALALGERGAYGQALVHGEAALETALEIESPVWEFAARMALGAALADLLAFPAALAHLRIAAEHARQVGALELQYLITGILAQALISSGQADEAAQSLAAAPAPLFSPEQTVGKRMVWHAQAALALAPGRPQAALEPIDALIAHAPNSAQSAVIPRLWRLRGESLRQLGHVGEAEADLQAAAAAAQEHEHLPAFWQAQLSLATLYRARRRIEQAEAAAATARATVQGLAADITDADLRTEFLDGFARLLPVAVPPTPLRAAKRTYDGLTAREREVAGLVAAGLSNRAIAERLVVSERTIEKHIENALAKLSFSSRAQLAVWAAERGLRAAST